MLRRVAAQAGDRGDVDDAAGLARDHAVLGDVLRQDEVAAHVEVHHLVPGLDRMVFGRRAPGGAGVVDQDVHVAHALQRLVGQAADVLFLGAVGGDPARVDAGGLQLGGGLLQVVGLARAQHDPRAGFAQRVGHLQAQAARAAGDQGGLAVEVEQLRNGTGHAFVPWRVPAAHCAFAGVRSCVTAGIRASLIRRTTAAPAPRSGRRRPPPGWRR